MKTMTQRHTITGVLVALLMLTVLTPGTGAAQEEDWQFGVAIYMWFASMEGTSAFGKEFEIKDYKLLDDLQMGFMGTLGAQKGRWMFLADAIYLDVEDGKDVTTGVRSDVELKGWIVTPAVGYTAIQQDRFSLAILAGARYFALDADVELDFSAPLPPNKQKVSESGHVWDGIVGLKSQVDLTEHWYLPLYLDVGTGNSKWTFQALGGIGYAFSWVDLLVTYRYLKWDFDDNKAFEDLEIYGPLAGVKFRF